MLSTITSDNNLSPENIHSTLTRSLKGLFPRDVHLSSSAWNCSWQVVIRTQPWLWNWNKRTMWELCTIAEILLAGIWTKLDIEFTSNVHNVCTTLTLTAPSHCQPAPSVGIELLIFHFTAFHLVLNLDRHLLPRPALPTWSPCLFPSPLIPFTLLSEVFTGHEVEAD